jgi:hypothetical protein
MARLMRRTVWSLVDRLGMPVVGAIAFACLAILPVERMNAPPPPPHPLLREPLDEMDRRISILRMSGRPIRLTDTEKTVLRVRGREVYEGNALKFSVGFAVISILAAFVVPLARVTHPARLGATRHSVFGAMIVAGLAGTAAALSASWLEHFLGERFWDPSTLLLPMALQGAIWSTIGAGVGLSIAFLERRPRGAATLTIRGMLGGLITACLWSPIVCLMDPSESHFQLLPVSFTQRVLWLMVHVGGISLCVGLGAERLLEARLRLSRWRELRRRSPLATSAP